MFFLPRHRRFLVFFFSLRMHREPSFPCPLFSLSRFLPARSIAEMLSRGLAEKERRESWILVLMRAFFVFRRLSLSLRSKKGLGRVKGREGKSEGEEGKKTRRRPDLDLSDWTRKTRKNPRARALSLSLVSLPLPPPLSRLRRGEPPGVASLASLLERFLFFFLAAARPEARARLRRLGGCF